MNIKRTLHVLLSTALIGGAVQASPLAPVTDSISKLESIIGDVCDAGSYSLLGISVDDVIGSFTGHDVRSLLYVCDYQSVLRQAERATTGLLQDLDTSGRTMGSNLLRRGLDIIGGNRGDETAQALDQEAARDRLAQALEDVRENTGGNATVADYQAALREEVEQAGEQALVDLRDALENYETKFEEGSYEYRMYEALSKNPLAARAHAGVIAQTTSIAGEAAETEAAYQASALAAEEFMDITGHQETIARTIAPSTATDPGGTAAQLEDRAGAATSTRESINELSRGWADYMRQDATLTGAVIEGLRATVQQQSLTNLQLKQEADRRFQERYDAIQAQQQFMETQLLTQMEEIESAMTGLRDGALSATSVISPQPIEGDYCDRNWCPPSLRPAAGD